MLKSSLLSFVLIPSQIISYFDFSRFIFFTVHLDVIRVGSIILKALGQARRQGHVELNFNIKIIVYSANNKNYFTIYV